MSTFATLILVVLFATVASAYACAVRSATLRRKFETLGNLPGRPLQEILRHVGKPSHRARLGAGREILEWRRVNFHVALRFTHDVCDGVDDDVAA